MKIDPSVYVHPNAALHGNLEIGKNSSIWASAVIRADFNYIKVGCYTSIQDNATLHASPTHPTTVGDYVTVAHSAVIHACTVGNRVLVGMGAIVLDGAQVGDGTMIAAGAVVKEGAVVPPNSLVVGVPGRIVAGKDHSEFMEQNAISYYLLSRKYISGEDSIDPEELMEAMASFKPEE